MGMEIKQRRWTEKTKKKRPKPKKPKTKVIEKTKTGFIQEVRNFPIIYSIWKVWRREKEEPLRLGKIQSYGNNYLNRLVNNLGFVQASVQTVF